MRRYLIASIAVAWGTFVFLRGSALLNVALTVAAFATLPLIIATFLAVDSGKRWRKYLRWLYAVLLAVFSVLLWDGRGSILYLVTVVILFWPEVIGRIGVHAMKKNRITLALLVLGLFAISFFAITKYHRIEYNKTGMCYESKRKLSDQEMRGRIVKNYLLLEKESKSKYDQRSTIAIIHKSISDDEIISMIEKSKVVDLAHDIQISISSSGNKMTTMKEQSKMVDLICNIQQDKSTIFIRDNNHIESIPDEFFAGDFSIIIYPSTTYPDNVNPYGQAQAEVISGSGIYSDPDGFKKKHEKHSFSFLDKAKGFGGNFYRITPHRLDLVYTKEEYKRNDIEIIRNTDAEYPWFLVISNCGDILERDIGEEDPKYIF